MFYRFQPARSVKTIVSAVTEILTKTLDIDNHRRIGFSPHVSGLRPLCVPRNLSWTCVFLPLFIAVVREHSCRRYRDFDTAPLRKVTKIVDGGGCMIDMLEAGESESKRFGPGFSNCKSFVAVRPASWARIVSERSIVEVPSKLLRSLSLPGSPFSLKALNLWRGAVGCNGMFVLLASLLLSLRGCLQTRVALHAENLALRHQLLLLQRVHQSRRLRLRSCDRLVWVWLSSVWSIGALPCAL
jgi:hypothetical protein